MPALVLENGAVLSLDIIEQYRDPATGWFLDQHETPCGQLRETLLHEERHALVDPSIVDEVSAKAEGFSLGHTKVKKFDRAVASANIGKTSGTGMDEWQIEMDARRNGESPNLAKQRAMYDADAALNRYHPAVLPFVAFALCSEPNMTMSGTRHKQILDLAVRSAKFKETYGLFPGEANRQSQVIFSHQEHYRSITLLQ